MQHSISVTRCARAAGLAAAFAGAALGSAWSQTADPAVQARQQYELDLAICNNAGYPAPQRMACVREAGQRYDRQRGASTDAQSAASDDGRASVITPDAGSASSLQGSTITTTPDGRATVVVPSADETR